ncbi:Translation initiation factor eIF-2B [Musa troglodytarum]|uniref:Translation initiation factor eIF2B subunit delta n=1 Tax=Musa troglodytarum TaxID=320322 RepID=A0A9E7H2A4_9LILI|nr:Translation initiation factor eIF-2B [Musa troglodytarum]
MHVPSWRWREYMHAKWFSSYGRTGGNMLTEEGAVWVVGEATRAQRSRVGRAGVKLSAAPGGAVPANTKQGKVVKSPAQKKDGPQVANPSVSSEKKVVDRPPEKDRKKDIPPPRMQFDDIHRVEKAKRRALVGLQYLSGNISGGNARCIAMFLAFREAIRDYSTPPEKALVRDLTAKINTMPESEVKSSLQSDIDRFINEKIVIADKVIIRHAVTKIRDGDVLLTYGSPCVVEMLLVYAHEVGKQFRVVIVDSRPKLEGQALLHRLVAKGISCTYTHVNAISYIMHEVTRVFLGAASVLSNGTVYSRVGTACVAMVANAFQVPVLICCEAYKFHERVQLDSICSNELGDPDVISKVPGRKDLNHLDNWADTENLQLLNLTSHLPVCQSSCENTAGRTYGFRGLLIPIANAEYHMIQMQPFAACHPLFIFTDPAETPQRSAKALSFKQDHRLQKNSGRVLVAIVL